MRFRRLRRADQGAPLAPLLDVVLLLLIFFVVTSSFAERQLALDLPSAEAAERAPTEALVINLADDGTLVVDDAEIEPEALEIRLVEARDASEPVEIRADASARHAAVVAILDLARRAGVESVGIAVGGGGGGGPEGSRADPQPVAR